MSTVMRKMDAVAGDLGLGADEIIHWGPDVAKVAPTAAFTSFQPRGRLVLVSSMTPSHHGEGKTTVTIGLAQAARRLGIRAVCALRQPSLGPIFGIKGGGAGGGRSRLEPQARVNLHLTGDLHAVAAAHNLLAALTDNALYFRNIDVDPRDLLWRRVVDMNDRFLRNVVVGIGGQAMGVPRETGFDITAASEVMAILCLADGYPDLKRRLGEILLGFDRSGGAVRARDVQAEGAMAALLRDALLPNLVQTTEGAPALVHGGPFANIAHGCNSLVATRLGLRAAEVLFTEAGFGFDLGGEKFLDLKCRVGGIWPHALVLVATVRTLKHHGGARPNESGVLREDPDALARGLENLDQHVASAREFGLDPIIALNPHPEDSPSELHAVSAMLRDRGLTVGIADCYAQGSEGALALAEQVLSKARAANPNPKPVYAYAIEARPAEKVESIARQVYGARSVAFTAAAKRDLERAERLGCGSLPVCIAKTPLSLSDDETKFGRPRDFELTVREVRVASGAGFLVALTGEILTMPGLPRVPHAAGIDLSPDGTILGAN